ncbi:MAG: hypothetical protein IAE80_20255 [Anaerolinea sp.]|nr:hypothetical protein [Anaerolinea sp.]
MSQQNPKQYKTEWTFSFEKLGEQIGEFFRSVSSGEQVEIKSATFTEPVGAATSARVRLDLSAGLMNVFMLENSDQLIDADVTYIGEMNFVVGGETEKVVSLNQSTTPGEWFRHALTYMGGGRQHLTWNVGLTPNVPIDLDINGGVGECKFELATLKPGKVDVSAGTGEITVTLPASSEQYSAVVNGGVGQFNIAFPAGSTVDAQVRAGTGEINVEFGVDAAVNLTINGGVGEVRLVIPPEAAVRIEGKAGIGDISVPAHYARFGGSDEFFNKSGVWQTANYESAARKINVHYNGGVGALVVR